MTTRTPLALLFLGLCIAAPAREIETAWRVDQTSNRRTQEMVWYQGESLGWTHTASDTSAPFDLTGREVRWTVIGPWAAPTGTYVNATGTISSATGGVVRVEMSPEAANLPAGTYHGFLRAYTSPETSTILVRQKIEVIWSDQGALYAMVDPEALPWETLPAEFAALSNAVFEAIAGYASTSTVAALDVRVGTVEGWGDHGDAGYASTGTVAALDVRVGTVEGWGDHGAAGYASTGTVAALDVRVGTVEGWGDHGAAGYASTGTVAALDVRVGTVEGWGDHGGAGYASTSTVAALDVRVGTVEGWGDHGAAGYASTGTVAALDVRVGTVEGWGDHGAAGYLAGTGTAARVATLDGATGGDVSGTLSVSNLVVEGSMQVQSLEPEAIVLGSSEDFSASTNVYWLHPIDALVRTNTVVNPISSTTVPSVVISEGATSLSGPLVQARWPSGSLAGFKMHWSLPADGHTNISAEVYFGGTNDFTESFQIEVNGYTAPGVGIALWTRYGQTFSYASSNVWQAVTLLPTWYYLGGFVASQSLPEPLYGVRQFELGPYTTTSNTVWINRVKVTTW